MCFFISLRLYEVLNPKGLRSKPYVTLLSYTQKQKLTSPLLITAALEVMRSRSVSAMSTWTRPSEQRRVIWQ